MDGRIAAKTKRPKAEGRWQEAESGKQEAGGSSFEFRVPSWGCDLWAHTV